MDGYSTSISEDANDGFIITNKHIVASASVKEKPTKQKSTQTGVEMDIRVYSMMTILPLLGIKVLLILTISILKRYRTKCLIPFFMCYK